MPHILRIQFADGKRFEFDRIDESLCAILNHQAGGKRESLGSQQHLEAY